MEKHYVTYVAVYDTSALPGLSTDMRILGGKVVITYIGNAIEELKEQRNLTELHERTKGISEMYELVRSLDNQSIHAIVEGLYDAGYRKE
ncbi:hypothetical protein [Vibrio cincinnatiensis]|uniref:hypothetical protein n=1 Tax=Vibrio cincinnatiensis TaxID=675 RepID=UPI001EDE7A0F|nr:hypothetical protein [Vibrio cincinnatiensis]MCG3727296.1 hypothetical protein [Vibrio cincinnatiensis]